MKLLFYFNGLNSGIPGDLGENPKIAEVEGLARRQGFEFIPLSIDYRKAEQHCEDILGRIDPDAEYVLFWGSSMGGWFARIMQLRLAAARPGLRVEAAAYNPAFALCEPHPLLLGPQEHKLTLEKYEWTPEFSAGLVRLEQSVDYDADLPYTVYVDREDEVIDASMSESRLGPIARFVVYEGGSHSFEHYREAVEDFENGCGFHAGQ